MSIEISCDKDRMFNGVIKVLPSVVMCSMMALGIKHVGITVITVNAGCNVARELLKYARGEMEKGAIGKVIVRYINNVMMFYLIPIAVGKVIK